MNDFHGGEVILADISPIIKKNIFSRAYRRRFRRRFIRDARLPVPAHIGKEEKKLFRLRMAQYKPMSEEHEKQVFIRNALFFRLKTIA